MKRTLAFILSLSMLTALTACSDNSSDDENATEIITDANGNEYDYRYQMYASMSPLSRRLLRWYSLPFTISLKKT